MCIRDRWIDIYGKKTGSDYSEVVQRYIQSKVDELRRQYPSHITIGPVGANESNDGSGWKFGKPLFSPSRTVYHVWGANNNNWNLPKGALIHGGGQAAYFHAQGPGVFGIVTTPLHGLPKGRSKQNYQ